MSMRAHHLIVMIRRRRDGRTPVFYHVHKTNPCNRKIRPLARYLTGSTHRTIDVNEAKKVSCDSARQSDDFLRGNSLQGPEVGQSHVIAPILQLYATEASKNNDGLSQCFK